MANSVKIQTQSGSVSINITEKHNFQNEMLNPQMSIDFSVSAFGLPAAPLTPAEEVLSELATPKVPRRSAITLAHSAPEVLLRFIAAVKALKNRNRSGSNISIYDEFVAVHLGIVSLARSESQLSNILNTDGLSGFASGSSSGTDGAHGGPAFLPWHRQFLLEFERALQSVDPTVTVPIGIGLIIRVLDCCCQKA